MTTLLFAMRLKLIRLTFATAMMIMFHFFKTAINHFHFSNIKIL